VKDQQYGRGETAEHGRSNILYSTDDPETAGDYHIFLDIGYGFISPDTAAWIE
jgi:hypothetical protein